MSDMTDTNGVSNLDVQAAAAPDTAGRSIRARLLGRLGRTVPPLVVFGTLLGLLAWGHHTGWTLPKFSDLTGGAAAAPDNWCEEHSVPESECVECNPNIMPRSKSFGWCKRHGVHDCPLEHPELAQVAGLAKVSPADLARAQRALEFADRPENSSKCKLHDRRIQFASTAAVEKAGVDVEPVWTAPVVEAVGGSGEITYDSTRTARISARVPGSVVRAYKRVGDRVVRGDIVALVDAAEVGKAKSDLLQAIAQVRLRARTTENLSSLARSGATSEQRIREAESALSEARIRLAAAQQALTNLGLPVQPAGLDAVPDDRLADHLRFLGIPRPLADSLDSGTATGNLLPVTAPLDGVVVTRDVVAGEIVDSAKVLFIVADVSRLWLTLDLRLEDARGVKVGQPVRFRPDGSKEEAAGTVAWVSTEADHKTRHGQGAGGAGQRGRPAAGEHVRDRAGDLCGKRSRPSSCPTRPCNGRATATSSSSATRTSSRPVRPRCSISARCGSGPRDAQTHGNHRRRAAGRTGRRRRAVASCGPNCCGATSAKAEGAASNGPVGPTRATSIRPRMEQRSC